MARPVVLKLGGELLETPQRLDAVAGVIARLADRSPLVVVHGGGREIDAELARRGIERRFVDGLRITDAPTLAVVVATLTAMNARLVAAICAAGAPAVGLTGADAGLGRVAPAAPYHAVDGAIVDLGFVGELIDDGRPVLLELLLQAGYTPAAACIGADAGGRLYNVNADVFAARLAARLRAQRLIVAGATSGVLDPAGRPIAELDADGAERMIRNGEASAGMTAKLAACLRALDAGVDEIAIVDGRDPEALHGAKGTRIVHAAVGAVAGTGEQHTKSQDRTEPCL
jgi:acetylglutamate kinase